ncbi:mechanosensitive ion channel family protein [Haloarchaeobius iranensis]|uniref:Mechanosensitive ion channel n=1 Tax=Haloarchaeobius iranensis TaxID=996166 RepID=A0A1G9TTV3_9EURY|nr:mechanosensitive ion channel family protein [Haloarchaeobius iranensis]SDM51153.1 Mechanosensitive ion channel [Haloarchaeobius iranensis]
MLDQITDLLAGYPPLQRTALVLGLSLVCAVVLEFVVLKAAMRFVSGTESTVDNIVVGELRIPIVVSAVLGGVWLLTGPGAVDTGVFEPQQLTDFFGQPSASVIVLVWARALNNIVNRAVEEVKGEGGHYDFAPVFSNVWTLVVLVGSAFLLLTIWNIEITPLLGAAGVAGIAIGFAAKDTVANFFGGLALYFDDTYKIGDYVVLDTGDAGTVVRVGIRSTTLLTRDEVMVTVPNSVLNSARIINESAPQRRKRIRVPLSVGYGTDLDEFEELVVAVSEAESLVKDSPKPRMRFRDFGDSGLEYELLCWVSSPSREQKTRHRLNRAIYKQLLEAEIEMPFPKRDVTLSLDESDRRVIADADGLATAESDDD